MADSHFDVIVIGGGPAGYVGAIRAAQLGYKVACIERAKLGGVCLNWGCIPSKSLLANAELVEKMGKAEDQKFWGLKISGKVELDWDRIIGRSREVATKLNGGIGFLFKKNKVTHIVGNAKIIGAATPANGNKCKVEVQECAVQEELTSAPATPGKTTQTLTADHVIVATGSVARDLPFAKFDGDRIWGAREAMFNKEKPKSLVVIGAGAIGMEFAYFYHTMGTKVTIIEMLDRVLPIEDKEIGEAMGKLYKKHGLDINTSTVTTAVEKTATGVKVTVAPSVGGKADETKKQVIEADRVLLAVGVVGRTDGLCDASLGLKIEKGHIQTDYIPGKTRNEAIDYKTNLPGVYAVGDVIGPPWLAHVASEEAITASNASPGARRSGTTSPIPSTTTSSPAAPTASPRSPASASPSRSSSRWARSRARTTKWASTPSRPTARPSPRLTPMGSSRSSAACPEARSWALTSWATRPPSSSPR
jgi:dihydrolipoamide dehydrogenase